MIVGSHSLDPKRILSSHYELHSNINGNIIYAFGIQYLVGNQLETKIQFGTLEDCIKWNKKIDKVIGKAILEDAIGTSNDIDEDIDDDAEQMHEKIGFRTNV